MDDSALMDRLSAFAAPRWHRGQLIGFSAVEGQTDYETGLVIRTTETPAALEIVHPGRALVAFGAPPESDIVVANDFFSFRSATGRTRGCLLDAHHLLIEGPASLSGTSEAIRAASAGGRCLVGPATR